MQENQLQEVLDRIGINDQYEEYFITDYESNFPNLKISKYVGIGKLNELAERGTDLDPTV